ncbi:hypothetical protein SAMN04490200_2714 [Pseudomonas proteolytica]|jgi:hypothetical protein|nr:hypothetical protein SAMN04490200_2714 [Pseudomonas proteolytica]
MVTTYPGSKLGGELEPLIIKSISTKIQKKKKESHHEISD